MNGVEWFSRKGKDCPENRDFGAYVRAGREHLLIIVDASQKGEKGQDLSKRICQHVTENAAFIDLNSPDNMISSLACLHEEIRREFIAETACYAVACINADGIGWSLNCGDCRIGCIRDGKKEWLSPVHTAANPLGGGFTKENAESLSRNKVTRCWKARGFVSPEMTPLQIGSSVICVATDGYWIEHEMLNVPLNSLSDDSSILIFNRSNGSPNIDGENFLGAV